MDPYVTCPYEAAHRVPRSRIQRHLVKCERHYPPLAICPYNATHRLPQDDMPVHVQKCPSKDVIFPSSINIRVEVKKPVKLPQHSSGMSNPNEEYWD